MFKKLVKWSSSLFGKGGEIETQKFEPLRRSTDKLDFPESEITEAYASGRLPKRTTYVGGRQVPPAPMPSKAPPQRTHQGLHRPHVNPFTENQLAMYNMGIADYPILTTRDSPPCEAFAGKGGEFSGAGASGSWDSPSSSSSDTSSSSSDSGSSSCGSD